MSPNQTQFTLFKFGGGGGGGGIGGGIKGHIGGIEIDIGGEVHGGGGGGGSGDET